MGTYDFTVYLNEGPTAMWEYKAGDPLRIVLDGLTVEASSIDDALDGPQGIWAIGNKQVGTDYPSCERSLCMGDVVYVEGPDFTGWQVAESFGWAPLPEGVR